MSTLKEKINEGWKHALRNKETAKKETLTMLKSAIKNAEIEKREELCDSGVVVIIQKEISKRMDAASQLREFNRLEQSQAEELEAEILKTYLPAQMSDEEVNTLVLKVIELEAATSVKDMGRVMKHVTKEAAGRADNKRVSLCVRAALS